MGFVVIDEAFDKWKSGYYEQYIDEWWQKDLGNMLLRDLWQWPRIAAHWNFPQYN